MLKLHQRRIKVNRLGQPPSGGCVLKQITITFGKDSNGAAAFRRLCVETSYLITVFALLQQPPSGGCVLKQNCKNYLD